MVKEFLKANKVAFKEMNLDENPAAIEEMVAKSGQMSVPVIDVDGKIIIGFDKPALKKALNLA
jgi:glutaredoxin